MVFENTSHAICIQKLKGPVMCQRRFVDSPVPFNTCRRTTTTMVERASQLRRHHFAPTVDNCGRWGRGGVFSALSARSPRPEQQYEMAHQMNDLHLGDVHLIAVDDLESRDTGRDFVRYL